MSQNYKVFGKKKNFSQSNILNSNENCKKSKFENLFTSERYLSSSRVREVLVLCWKLLLLFLEDHNLETQLYSFCKC